MEFVVIGAGAIGSAVAGELVASDDVSAVRILDSHARALAEIGEAVRSPKLQSFQVDARDRRAVEPLLEGAGCVIGAGSPALSTSIARLALQARSHYCDLGGPDAVLDQQLGLRHEAEARGRWIVPGCGLSPGLVNMACVAAVDEFDSVDGAYIRVGDVPREPVAPFRFQVTSSAAKLIEDYTQPVVHLRDGKLVTSDPLTDEESIDFGTPFDRMEAFATSGSLSLLASELAGRVRNLDHKTVRWPGHLDQMRFVLGLGFGDDRTIDVRTHLTYRDLLIRRLLQRLPQNSPDAVLMRIVVHGHVEARIRSLVYEMREEPAVSGGMTAMGRCTAVPVAVVARLLAAGAVPGGGASPPERVITRPRFLEMIAERGLDLRARWHEGWVDVGRPAG